MASKFVFLVLIPCATLVCEAAIFFPITDSHRSATLELFKPVGGSFGRGFFSPLKLLGFSSLCNTMVAIDELISLELIDKGWLQEALQTFEVLGIERQLNIRVSTCASVSDTLGSSSSSLKDLFYALRAIPSRHEASVHKANSLLDFYYSVGSLRLIKDQTTDVNVLLCDGDGIFQSVEALSQSDGRWRCSSSQPASSYAAGNDLYAFSLETLAGVISLAFSEIDQSQIGMLKNDIVKLFDGIGKYGPLSATSSVVRGLAAFLMATSGSLNDKILGVAKFFLGIGLPGNAKDFYDQIEALACLERNRVSVPLISSLLSTIVSLTRGDQLKVKVNTVLGSRAPPLSVKLMKAFRPGSKDSSITESQELKFDQQNDVHVLDALPNTVDTGNYFFIFKTLLHDPEHKKIYVTGGQMKVPVFVTGVVKVDNAEITVLDRDTGSIETQKNQNSLNSNFQFFCHTLATLSFQLTSPRGHAFKPHQAFLKLRHQTKVENIFVLENSGKRLEIILDFLRLVENFFYLSGRYDTQLVVGDAVMENSFLRELGSIELDLPEPPEKADSPSSTAYNSHIQGSEKHPPQQLSVTLLALLLLPFLGLLSGLLQQGVNLKNFPKSSMPAIFAIFFHLGIAAVLLLYVMFWLKLDLFTTLKALGFFGIFLTLVGHRMLSHLASTSS
ncbi:Dolichyl-diphosphooligosaccharide--protein glycotransferase [Bertholletia excelsa]